MAAIGDAGVFDFNPLLSMVVEEVLNQGALAAIVLAITVIVMMAFRPTLLKPGGRSRTEGSKETRVLNCANCRQPMAKLDSESVLPHLSQPQQVAQKIGSVNFEGWQCPKCHPNLTGEAIHIRAYVLNPYYRFSICRTCQELTIERTSQILQPATYEMEGKRLFTDTCHCCSYFEQSITVIPQNYRYSSSDNREGDSCSSDSDGSWGWGDNGGDFGGGDSGGGGDGGSW